MSPHHMHYLRAFRKRSRLTQTDIAFLLGLPEDTTVSHFESGRRFPSLEIVILYHFLFEIPHDTLFHERKDEFQNGMTDRIKQLLDMLHQLPFDRHVRKRIVFLDATLRKLAPQNV